MRPVTPPAVGVLLLSALVVDHYRLFFLIVTDLHNGNPPLVILNEQDKQDIVAFMKLLD